MRQIIESNLYTDPQAVRPAAYCPRCGGALYPPSLECIRCGRENP